MTAPWPRTPQGQIPRACTRTCAHRDLDGVGPPHRGSGRDVEPVRGAKCGEPCRGERKEDRLCIAERHSAGDAQGLPTGADRDSGHVAEQELPSAWPEYLEPGGGCPSAGLLEEVDHAQPEGGAAVIQGPGRAEKIIGDLLGDVRSACHEPMLQVEELLHGSRSADTRHGGRADRLFPKICHDSRVSRLRAKWSAIASLITATCLGFLKSRLGPSRVDGVGQILFRATPDLLGLLAVDLLRSPSACPPVLGGNSSRLPELKAVRRSRSP